MRVAAAFAMGLLLFCAAMPAQAGPAGVPPLARALVVEAAGRLDDALAAVAQSTRSLGAAYAALSREAPAATPEERGRFLQSYAVKDGTVAFRDPQSPCGPEPAAKAPCPALLFYDGENFTDETFRQLAVLSRLAPAMAAAHDAFPFSWVYLTTPGQNFAIYPYLPLAEAVANAQPTDKDFYKAANFKDKDCGWQSPYLDLVGAGMMVTVSCPAYDGETLLAVASRDVTLAQLSDRIMADLAGIPGARAVLMNRRGKAIAASDPKLSDFIVSENTKADDAVVYFRADRGLAALGLEKGLTSPDEAVNLAAEEVVSRHETDRDNPMVFTQGKDTVLAARLRTTGWYLVLLIPQKASR